MRHGSREAKPASDAARAPARGSRSAAGRSRCRPGLRGRTTGVHGGGRVGVARTCGHRAVVANARPLGQFRARPGRRIRRQTRRRHDRLSGARPLPTSSGSAAQGPSIRQRAPAAASRRRVATPDRRHTAAAASGVTTSARSRSLAMPAGVMSRPRSATTRSCSRSNADSRSSSPTLARVTALPDGRWSATDYEPPRIGPGATCSTRKTLIFRQLTREHRPLGRSDPGRRPRNEGDRATQARFRAPRTRLGVLDVHRAPAACSRHLAARLGHPVVRGRGVRSRRTVVRPRAATQRVRRGRYRGCAGGSVRQPGRPGYPWGRGGFRCPWPLAGVQSRRCRDSRRERWLPAHRSFPSRGGGSRMRRVLFHVRGVPIWSYPALLYVGLVCGFYVMYAIAPSVGMPRGPASIATLIMFLPAIVGSRIWFVLDHWATYRHDLHRIWRHSDGGMTLYGGLVLALVLSPVILAPFAVEVRGVLGRCDVHDSGRDDLHQGRLPAQRLLLGAAQRRPARTMAAGSRGSLGATVSGATARAWRRADLAGRIGDAARGGHAARDDLRVRADRLRGCPSCHRPAAGTADVFARRSPGALATFIACSVLASAVGWLATGL